MWGFAILVAVGALNANVSLDVSGGTNSTVDPLEDCFNEVNYYRHRHSLPALHRATGDEGCVNAAAKNDYTKGFHNSFGSCHEGGQCECSGTATTRACVAMWYAEGPSGGHYQIMMGKYTKVACGVFSNFVTADFWG